MEYQEFLNKISRNTGVHHEVVRMVIAAIPDVLFQMVAGEEIKTPLGTFRAKYTKGGRKTPASNGQVRRDKSRVNIYLKPKKKFTIKEGNPLFRFFTKNINS